MKIFNWIIVGVVLVVVAVIIIYMIYRRPKQINGQTGGEIADLGVRGGYCDANGCHWQPGYDEHRSLLTHPQNSDFVTQNY